MDAEVLVARFEVPDGHSVQAFAFALDCTPEQAAGIRRQFGGRRYARNWAVRIMKDDLDRYHATGQETDKPSLAGLRMRWNRVKDSECRDRETGEAWWPEISKEAFADGIKAAVDGYWNWQQSRAGERAGKKVGFPTRRQLGYKSGWYGSRLVIADRFFPSSKTCHACGHVQDIGWAEHWACAQCGAGQPARRQRRRQPRALRGTRFG